MLSMVTRNDDGTFTVSEPISFLSRGVTVTYGLVISSASCVVDDSLMEANISIQRIEPGELDIMHTV